MRGALFLALWVAGNFNIAWATSIALLQSEGNVIQEMAMAIESLSSVNGRRSSVLHSCTALYPIIINIVKR